jgi:hypothetical protein
MRTLIIITLFPFCTIAQTNWEKVETAAFMTTIREYEQSVSPTESYSLETGYKIFNDYSAEIPSKVFDGKLICKSGEELNIYQVGHLIIQDVKINLTIDTTERQILVQHADPSFLYRKTVQDFAAFSEITQAAYKKVSNGKTIYMLELKKGYPYQAMEFVFSTENEISQIVIYSNQPYYIEDDNYAAEKAKIVLDFTNFKKGKKVNFNSFLTVKDCVLIKDSEITPIGRYKDFEIIDLRN